MQDDCVESLPLGELAKNHVVHTSTRVSRFCVTYPKNVVMQFNWPKRPSVPYSEIHALSCMAGSMVSQYTLGKQLEEA